MNGSYLVPRRAGGPGHEPLFANGCSCASWRDTAQCESRLPRDSGEPPADRAALADVSRAVHQDRWGYRQRMSARRAFLVCIVASLSWLPPSSRGQPSKRPHIGWLSTAPHPFIVDFRQELRELGYRDGREPAIEERYATVTRENLPDLATQLVALKVDLIVASGFAAGQAAKRVTGSIPIVAVTRDLVEGGLAASLARPGANATGFSIMSAELGAKWVELLRETVPNLSRVAFLRDATDAPPWTLMDAAARAVGVTPIHLEAGRAEELPQVFEESIGSGAEGIVVLASPFFASQRALLVALAQRHRMPAMYENSNFVEAGGLISYGPDLRETFRRVARYVDLILRGARPGDLPVQQPTHFELVVNMKTAQALGLTVPRSIVLRADRVIN